MSLHEDINVEMHRIADNSSAEIITPNSLALAVHRQFVNDHLEPHIEYASIEHFKHLARKVLSCKHDTESDENEVYQGELFSGVLQVRYPIPRKRGEEPAYKLRELLNHEEIHWNVAILRKSAEARLQHADALEAWAQSREAA
ncbi:MAG: hypothetical protein LBV29_01150 [Azoarcus sp.]|jgi:hypothetical protein|nr:hypothetical protein [Azoarcus sp.]